uniref:transposase n=1 Tax=Limosilactobacillus equigenerosi TaxID=417373 RepID=UPI000A6F767D
MSNRTSKHTLEQRLNAVLKIINGTHSINQVSNELWINSKTLSLWISKYKKRGITGLKESHSWKKYSEDIKRKAVLDYLNNHLSLLECCRKYDISSDSVLRRWIKQYTDGKTLKTTGGSTKMKASRN